jgi:transcriptional regulator with XRE-family HTH domain
MMLGKTAKHLRETQGLNQRQAAEKLDVSVVHLCNIENDKALPSAALIERYRELWGVDLYVLAWCLHGDVKNLPAAIRKPAEELAKAWGKQLGALAKRTDSSCSTSND